LGGCLAASNDSKRTVGWEELRRRKVAQWGIAYAASAWALLQVLQFLSEVFAWPTPIVRLATVGFACGLPIALVLAWFHGDRGHQRVGRAEWALLMALLVAGTGATWWFGRTTVATTEESAAVVAPQEPAAPDRSIAVLPFTNLSGDPKQEFLSDGLSDTLIQQLSQVPELKVVARSSSFRFKGQNADLVRVGRELHVGAILEGSVQRSGKRIRVGASLVDARNGSNFWSKTFDRQADDIFGIQDEIAAEVLKALRIILLSNAMSRQTVSPYRNLPAYEAYLQGRAGLERRSGESLKQAVAAFSRATELDPDYALAYVGLAHSLMFLRQRQLISSDDARTRAREAVERAITIDPGLGEAYAARAPLEIGRGGYAAAEASYQKSIELAPGYAPAYYWYGGLLQSENRFADAEQVTRKAIALDPLSPTGHMRLAAILYRFDRPEEAYREDLASIAIDPRYAHAYAGASVFHEKNGRPDEAARWLRKAAAMDPSLEGPQYATLAVLSEIGDESLARRRLLEAAQRFSHASWPDARLAQLAFRHGDCVAARESAGRALKKNDTDELALYVDSECLLAAGDVTGAIELFRRHAPGLLAEPPDLSGVSSAIAGVEAARVLSRAGQNAQARKLVGASIASLRDEARGDDPSPRWWLVVAYAVLEDRDAALAELRRLVDGGTFWGWRILSEQNALVHLQQDPEFRRLLRRLEATHERTRASLGARPELSDEDVQAEIKKYRAG
jgi:TolB-like protein/Flp pilus assembly protein TadD